MGKWAPTGFVRLIATDSGEGTEFWVNPRWVASVRTTPRSNMCFVDLVGAEGHFVEGDAEDVAWQLSATRPAQPERTEGA